ncbi:MAG: recombinase family protein [Vicinamibacterales bacterium]
MNQDSLWSGQMRAILYSRVSTDAQERDGTSLDTQERACTEFARAQGWQVVESVRDAASGFSLDRPGIERVRRLLRDGGADVLLAYAIDRLARNQQKLAVLVDEVEEAGARLDFVTERFEDTAVGKLILSVRAFAAEVEREKISERTLRGKLERAKSGRIPQAFGRGCYGYVYNPATGQREIEPYQSEVVRRIFTRFTELRSFDRVCTELRRDRITTFEGGRWYPIGVRRVLENESYVGRLVYRRSRWIKTRGRDGRLHRKQVERPAEDHVEIVGASPQIVDETLWQRVQAILNDPERTRRSPTPARTYELRGRTKCGVCGASMVGQTLKVKGKPYPYYRCRFAYDKLSGQRCDGRYVRAIDLEDGIWREVTEVLSRPSVVLNEYERAQTAEVQPDHAEERARLEKEVASLKDREKRLVRLYTFGEIDDDTVRSEGDELRRRRQLLEERLAVLSPTTLPAQRPIDAAMLEQACRLVREWLDNADTEKRMMALEALQVAVTATREAATVTGVLPVEAPEFITEEQSCP